MTNQNQNPKKLDLDEIIAILVAFSVIGTILAWGLTRKNQFTNIISFGESSQVTSPVEPLPTPESEVVQSKERPRTTVTKQVKTVVIVPPPPRRVQAIPTPVPTPVAVTTPTPTPTPTPVAVTTPTPTPTPTPVATTTPTPQNVVEFPDITIDYWAYPFIVGLVEKQMFKELQGGDFRPNDLITREEYAHIISEALTLTSKQEAIDFEDVEEESPEKEEIDLAVRGKFLEGYPGQKFEPDQPITKLEVLLSLASGLELQPPEDPETILAGSYQDWQEIPEYAQSAIAAATESGLVINYPNLKMLKPNEQVSRAEVAAMVHQALVVMEKQSPVESEYIVVP